MFFDIYIGVVIFLTGLVLGSFYNVCIYRIPEDLSVITPPSRCGRCGHRLAPLDLIPVVSWLMLGRKCRYCKEPISARYPLVELLTGTLFVLQYVKSGISWELLVNLVFISILVMVAFIDIDHRIIPDRFVVIGLVIGLIKLLLPILIVWAEGLLAHIGRGELLPLLLALIPWKDALIGAAVGVGSLLLVDLAGRIFFKKEGMGFGDVKLMGMAGLFLGTSQTVLALLVAVWIAAIAGLIILKRRKGSEDHYMPFGPFLTLGCLLSVFIGDILVKWYISFL